MDSIVALFIAAVVIAFFMWRELKDQKKKEAQAHASAEKGKLYSEGPRAQHPHIDAASCIGCAACTLVCPEGDVLGMLGGKAAIINGHKCIGHSLCADACPVGAITIVMASPSMGADMAYLTPEYETTIKNLFIVGELGGLALIKNAVNQGRDCIDNIENRVKAMGPRRSVPNVHDVLIVGAGPAGISASLRAIEKKLNYLTVDEGEMGGTVAKYPRQKLVMTSPVEFPTYGKFKKTELSKEELLTFWDKVLHRVDFKFRKGEKVGDIKKGEDGIFTVVTTNNQYRSHAVILAIGKGGSPRKLGVKGEELPKVMYRVIEADHYVHKKILVVGGGDSAVEAAMGLAHQVGNKVTLSYRKEAFSRIKERNAKRIEECMRKKQVNVIFNSSPLEFKQDSVVLEVNGKTQEIPNDYVWIFAGGEPPTAFLKKIGVGFGEQDMTSAASKEARELRQVASAPSPETSTRKALAPDFTLRDVDGNAWSLHDYRGKFVLLDFWAVQSGPCRAQLSRLEEIQREYGNHGLEVVTINEADPPDAAASYIHLNRFTFTALLDPDLTVSRLYDARYIPTLVLIDPEGNVVLHGVGYHPCSRLRSDLVKAGLPASAASAGSPRPISGGGVLAAS